MLEWHLRRTALSAICGAFVCMSQGQASEYAITSLGMGGNADDLYSSIEVYDINIHGEVVGRAAHGFLWKGVLVDVLRPYINDFVGGSIVSAINDLGHVVGTLSDQYGNYETPFVWHQETGLTRLEFENAEAAIAQDVNNKQQVAGSYWNNSDSSWHANMWQADGRGVPLSLFSDGESIATALNNAEPTQVVGAVETEDGRFTAFLWAEDGGLRDLGEFQEEPSVATAINDHGAVVGWFGAGISNFSWDWGEKSVFTTSSDSRAFLWSDAENPWLDLGTLAVDNRGQSVAYAINNAGQVVGYAETDNGELHAFLYTSEGGMLDLNNVLPAESDWVLHVAHGINQQGQIVGWGTRNGAWWPFLLTPPDISPVIDIAVHHDYDPQNPRVDEPLTLRVTLVNEGTEPVSATVQHTFVAELDIISIPDACTQDGQKLECGVPELLSGESITRIFDVLPRAGGRRAVASYATATTAAQAVRLAEQKTFIPVTRHEPEIAPAYHIVDLGDSVVTAENQGPRINNWGEVALGTGTFYSGGVLQTAGEAGEKLYDVNDMSWFVGMDGHNTAVWQQDEEVWLGLGGLTEGISSEAFGVNAFGQMVGQALDSSNTHKAFIASLDSAPQELGSFGGGSEALDINDDAWIVGNATLAAGESRAFLFRDFNTGLQDLGTLGGADSWAYAINNTGVIVGQAETAGGELHAARWSEEGTIEDLGVLFDDGKSCALDINDVGLAVGSASWSDGGRRAVRYVDGRVEDLNEWLPGGSPWQLERATGINERGEIVGVGLRADAFASHAFMITPLFSAPLFGIEQRITTFDNPLGLDARQNIALDGDILAIGHPGAGDGETGVVAIYQRVDDQWEYQLSLLAGDGLSGDQFGRTLALEGTRLAVGAKGAVYVFEKTGEVWAQVGGKLISPPPNEADESFGEMIALDGDTLVTRSATGPRINVYDGIDWQEEINLGQDNLWGLALLDGRIFVGHSWRLVDIYGRQGSNWVLEQSLSLTETAFDMAVDGDVLVIGSNATFWLADDSSIINSGLVYVFQQRDGKWFQHSVLSSSGQEDSRVYPSSWAVDQKGIGERFGYSVAIEADMIAVGAPYGNEDEDAAGGVYIFQRHGNQWIEEVKLTTSDPVVNQQLGWSVAVGDGVLVGSAPNRPDGAFYSYNLNHSPDSADVQLFMTANRHVVGVGEWVTYTFTVNNLNDAVSATGIEVNAIFPAELKLVEHPLECEPQAGLITCGLDIVEAGTSRSIILTAEALTVGTATHQAWVSAYQHDPNQSDNEATLATVVETEPPPRIVMAFEPPGDGSGVFPLFSFDALALRFELENLPSENGEEGHVHWQWNDDDQGDLESTVIDLSDFDGGDHTVTVQVVDADHSEVFVEASASFTIERLSWPSVIIEVPQDGAEFVANSPIQLRYELNFAGVADGLQDFLLTIDDNAPVPLADSASLLFDDFLPGTHTIEIRYNQSTQADASVSFTVLANDVPDPNDEDDPKSGGGGGALDVQIALLLLMALGLKIVWMRRLAV